MSYTPAQVGAANVPDAHLSDDAPGAQSGVDFTGDEFESWPSSTVPSSARNWRSSGRSATPAVGIGLGTDQTTRANEHANPGKPDGRRTERELGGHPGSPELVSLSPSPESPHNDRDAVAINPEPAPQRARQGFTGADPARVAQTQRTHFIRPFDQNMAQHPGPVEKVGQANPTAARPPDRARLLGGLPSPMGSESSAREGVSAQLNTFRLRPRAWDELLVNEGGAPAPVSARARGWRL